MAERARGFDEEVTASILRISAKLLNTARAGVVGLIIIIIGGTGWVTRVNLTLESIQHSLGDATGRIKSVEALVGEGILERAEQIVSGHERRIDALEREVVRLSTERPGG